MHLLGIQYPIHTIPVGNTIAVNIPSIITLNIVTTVTCTERRGGDSRHPPDDTFTMSGVAPPRICQDVPDTRLWRGWGTALIIALELKTNLRKAFTIMETRAFSFLEVATSAFTFNQLK